MNIKLKFLKDCLSEWIVLSRCYWDELYSFTSYFQNEKIKPKDSNEKTIYDRYIESPDDHFCVFIKNDAGNTIGYLLYSSNEQKIEAKELYVFPDFRNKGYGSQLLQFVIGLVKDRDLVFNIVATKNRDVLAHFLKKNGIVIRELTYGLKNQKDMEDNIDV